MTIRAQVVRLVRGSLIFIMGLVIGGAGVYHWAGKQRSFREVAMVSPSATRPAVDPATPPKEPVGTRPRADLPPDEPSGQFDASDGAASTSSALIRSKLLIPVHGVASSQLTDTFSDARSGGRVHDAIDIMAPAGTPVVAVADGTIVKLFNSKLGGTTLYQFDDQGEVAYYYAHMQAYAPNVVENMKVKQGDVIGYVGSTGNASPTAPHLHFAIMVLGPEKDWWKGVAINPFPFLGGEHTPVAPTVAPTLHP
ncbi:peptidoglycan DD-metalloendopeptidase family protein [Lysobacter sp. HDW10]|uniref:M23 family metallopeptidase n=1 Tax=Lysobacter sp. HDW10 TaxID=2714936 RepID=UPI00140A8517|nr:M23 family metallopeptidase [Lysobacter sp. HDW10]QIK80603.1 peptidoglycan DD-metalloendopeptidase family protein [Lysobacter sp. HDW10]